MGNSNRTEQADQNTGHEPRRSEEMEQKPSKWDKCKWYRVKNRSKKTLSLGDASIGDIVRIKPKSVRAVSGSDLLGFDDQEYSMDQIDIRELSCIPEDEYRIWNLTKESIIIKHNIFPDMELSIPGFSSRKLSGKTLLGFDYLEWENQGLIQIDSLTNGWNKNKWYRVKSYTEKDLRTSKGTVILKAKSVRVLSGKDLQEKFEGEKLNKLEESGDITIRELDIDPEKEYNINNLTTERITIKHNALPNVEFFVPGSGSRKVGGKTLLSLDYMGWENQGLIQIDPVTEQTPSSVAESLMGLAVIVLIFVLVLGVGFALSNPDIALVIYVTLGVVTLAALGIIRRLYLSLRDRRRKKVVDSMKNGLTLLPGLALILGTGIGLPILIMNFAGTTLLDTLAPSVYLRIGFIAIASILPAFLFYLFGRQQVEEQRENFFREAMLLDPNVWSYGEAKNKYGPMLNTVYETGNSPFSIILLVITTALLVTGWIIALYPIDSVKLSPANALDFFLQPYTSPFTLGFLGAYFFTINLVYRRYVRSDLTPKTYAYLIMRLITTFVLVWAVSTLPQFGTDELSKGLPALAFIIGIFPESALTLIQDYVNRLTARRGGQDSNQYSLTKLEGMNLYDQARLMEEGIENIENLAHHNLMELIVRTRIPTVRLVDMYDQAILYLHLGEESKNENDESIRKLLKNLGVRTATDLLRCRKRISELPDGASDIDMAKLKKKLDIIIVSMQDDEWLNYISCWRKSSSTRIKQPINDPYNFYIRATGIEAAQEKKDAGKSASAQDTSLESAKAQQQPTGTDKSDPVKQVQEGSQTTRTVTPNAGAVA